MTESVDCVRDKEGGTALTPGAIGVERECGQQERAKNQLGQEKVQVMISLKQSSSDHRQNEDQRNGLSQGSPIW